MLRRASPEESSSHAQAGISVLPAPDGPVIYPITADRTETSFVAQSFSSRGRHLSPRRRATGWSPCFQGIPQTPLATGSSGHRMGAA